MKICVVGAGAIGGFVGTKLALGGVHDVSALARGATLAALRQHGWRLRQGGALRSAPARAADHAAALGAQDLVVIAVKGPSLPEVAPTIAPLLAAHTLVLPAMNGVPWWFGRGVPALQREPLTSVDPGGVVGAALPFEQVLGCVVHASTWTSEPGLVEHNMGQGLIVGEPAGGESSRVQALADALRPRVRRHDVGQRAARHLVQAVGQHDDQPGVGGHRCATDRVLDDPLVLAFCSAATRERRKVGAQIGCAIDQQPEDATRSTRKLGSFRPSMLQDVEAGRTLELDAIVGVVREIAQRVGWRRPTSTRCSASRVCSRARAGSIQPQVPEVAALIHTASCCVGA
jgi:2-dehydropantoate 2-reductase